MIGACHRRLRQEAGLTLSEMLVVLAIMGIILAALALVLSMSITQSSQIQEQSTLQTEVRATIDTMAREIRQAYTGDTSYPIETATSTTLQFLSPDKAVPFHNRRIAYRLAGGQIDRALTTSTDTDGPPWTGFAWTILRLDPVGIVEQAGRLRHQRRRLHLLRQERRRCSPARSRRRRSYRVVITVDRGDEGRRDAAVHVLTSASLRWAP